jgi:xylulose-5-phosphate/fructose-6-phosphate phosphoketolase
MNPTSENALNEKMLRNIDAYWRAANYLSVGQIYLCDNPLLKEPLKLEHIKKLLLGRSKLYLCTPKSRHQRA